MAPGNHAGRKGLKREGWAMALNLVFGFVGLLGVGHFYLGALRRGFAFLLGGWAALILMLLPTLIFLLALGLATSLLDVLPIVALFSVDEMAQAGRMAIGAVLLVALLSLVAFLGYLGLWLWGVFDASRVFRKRFM